MAKRMIQMSKNKDAQKIYDFLAEAGVRLEYTKNGHVKIFWPSGRTDIQPTTPGNPGAQTRYLRQQIRREGIRLP